MEIIEANRKHKLKTLAECDLFDAIHQIKRIEQDPHITL